MRRKRGDGSRRRRGARRAGRLGGEGIAQGGGWRGFPRGSTATRGNGGGVGGRAWNICITPDAAREREHAAGADDEGVALGLSEDGAEKGAVESCALAAPKSLAFRPAPSETLDSLLPTPYDPKPKGHLSPPSLVPRSMALRRARTRRSKHPVPRQRLLHHAPRRPRRDVAHCQRPHRRRSP